MRVLWVGDAIVSSGFAQCTHAVCDYLHAQGHEIHILGINYFGDPHDKPYKIYPCRHPFEGGNCPMGSDRLPRLISQVKPDVVIILNDPWNIPRYITEIDLSQGLIESGSVPPIICWLAVDGENQQHAVYLNHDLISSVVVWTQFASDELAKSGCNKSIQIVPLGVDTDLFYPRDKKESRLAVCPPVSDDAFIIGVVGRNQIRKRLDLTIQYFAEWVDSYLVDNAYLYLHVGPTGDSGFDIRSLSKYYGIGGRGRIILSEPNIGLGYGREALPLIYSSFDVYLTTTQGEGWGLPCLEAMACGVPCVVPDWSGLGSLGWTDGAAYLVPCTGRAVTAPINYRPYTIGGIADKDAMIEALNIMYSNRAVATAHAQHGLALANKLSWTSTAKSMSDIISSLVDQ